jgi:general secretion pathway protein E
LSSYLENETYLLDLLIREKLISSEQRRLISAKKSSQRQKLVRSRLSQQNRGSTDVEMPDYVEIISSLDLKIPGKKNKSLTEERIVRAIAEDLSIPFKKLDPLDLDLKIVTKTIPKSFAVKHLLLPFSFNNGVLDVAIYDPDNRSVLEEIERANQVKVRFYLSPKSDIKKMLAEFFGFQSTISAAETHLGTSGIDVSNMEQLVHISSTTEIGSSDRHIKGAVDHLFNYAFEQRASDIHIEPKRDLCLVRLRIDGVLHSVYNLPKVVHAAMISRIKTLSRMDIAEKRRPQDGRIKVDRNGKEAEIRVSTIPVAFGEKAVMRILDPDVLFQELTGMGFSKRDYDLYNGFITSPHGIVLVTGPTGSGKSTTLYSTLKNVATPEKNVITVEDPVEMVHEEFNQISVQPNIEVTFSNVLRSILRQDPDIIMIGEIRDYETASHAVQAALTGHLVFSTLHTNDAISSVSRLLDLGVQPFLIGSTMLGVIAQRLVRRICPHCIEEYYMTLNELNGLGMPTSIKFAKSEGRIKLHRGSGCRQCRSTGYIGRCGVFEVFPLTDKTQQMVSSGETDSNIRKIAIGEGMTTLKHDAWIKVLRGISTSDEAIRVTGMTE